MKLTKTRLVVLVGLCIVMGLLTVFALELSNTQAKSKNDVTGQVHDRAVLAAALIDSLFQSVQQQVPQDSKTYGGRVVTAKQLNAGLAQGDTYLVLLGPDGRIVAATSGATARDRGRILSSAALGLLRTGHPYGLGNYAPYKSTGVIDFAVPFPTPYGTRTLVSGFTPGALSAFIAGELKTVPGVKGSLNYLLDGNDIVLASTDPGESVGQTISRPGAVAALEHPSADTHGTYFDQVTLTNSTWRIVLSSPDGALFASVTGVRQVVPWVIFVAFAIFALAALALGWGVLRSANRLQAVNLQLERVNEELTEANSSLERRAAELARSNEELDQFASIASHDLQEPLRKVRTFTEQLTVMESDRLSDKGRDYLLRANAAAERMQKLIEDLLKFSRVSTQGRPFVPVDLAEITRGALSDLDAQIADLSAVVTVGPLPTIDADPLQMHQLILNLVSNALKFHREGVTPEVQIDSAVAGGSVTLTVRDNGIGFEPRYGQRIFRVFERLHGRGEYPGTGIGLALCRKIVDRHGGTIIADGEPGVGSTFTISLPLRHVPAAPDAEAEVQPETSFDLREDHVHA